MAYPQHLLRRESDAESLDSIEAFTMQAVEDVPTEKLVGDGSSSRQVAVPEARGLRKLWAYLGPGFVVAIAYIDPGNFESDLKAGALFKYELLWVLLLASIAGLLIQSLAANLGVVTGKHLAELCRSEYPHRINISLWLIAEVAIVASDIPEVIGTAFALRMLFHIPLWVGVILTGFSTLILLALQQYGVRKLEAFITLLVFIIAACFFIEMGFAQPNLGDLLFGMFIPTLSGNQATAIAISLIGAVVMPHNLYLHSALVLSRKIPRTTKGVKDGCRYNFVECSLALLLAFLINLSVIAVSGAVCSRPNLTPADADNCVNISIDRTPFLLKKTLGRFSEKLFAVALLASGQSSTITGTYAGQFVMQGFLELQFQPWLRNLFTRLVAIVPSLVVSLVAGNSGAGQLIIISSIILSFELPFALIPLLKFTSSPVKMGPFVNHPWVTLGTWATGILVAVINVYFVGSACVSWLVNSNSPNALLVFFGLLVAGIMLLYLGAIIYLALRPDSEVTYLPHDGESGSRQPSLADFDDSSASAHDSTGSRNGNGFRALRREDVAKVHVGLKGPPSSTDFITQSLLVPQGLRTPASP